MSAEHRRPWGGSSLGWIIFVSILVCFFQFTCLSVISQEPRNELTIEDPTKKAGYEKPHNELVRGFKAYINRA